MAYVVTFVHFFLSNKTTYLEKKKTENFSTFLINASSTVRWQDPPIQHMSFLAIHALELRVLLQTCPQFKKNIKQFNNI